MEFFPDDELKNKAADDPWKKSETDKMLDLYFSGAHPNSIAQSLGRNPKAVKRRLEQFTYNERDRSISYEPFRRASRKGKRITQNEKLIIESHRERKVPVEVTAKVLMREVEEIRPDTEGQIRHTDGKQVAPTLDLLLAYRYALHVYKKRLVSEKTYEGLAAEEIEYGTGREMLGKDPKDYPRYIRSLALYLVEKHES